MCIKFGDNGMRGEQANWKAQTGGGPMLGHHATILNRSCATNISQHLNLKSHCPCDSPWLCVTGQLPGKLTQLADSPIGDSMIIIIQCWTCKINNFASAWSRFFGDKWTPESFSGRLKTSKSTLCRLSHDIFGWNDFLIFICPLWGQFVLSTTSIDIMACYPIFQLDFCLFTGHSTTFPVNLIKHSWSVKKMSDNLNGACVKAFMCNLFSKHYQKNK